MSEYQIPDDLVEQLNKGDTLTYKSIRHLLPEHHRESERRVSVVEWASLLSRALKAAGKACTIITAKGSHEVVLLTDSEAAEHNRDRFASYIRRAKKRHRHALEVDTTNLNLEDKRLHERAVAAQVAKLAALDSVRLAVPTTSNVRSTPAIRIHRKREGV